MQIKDKKAIIIGPVGRLAVAFCRELLRNGAGVCKKEFNKLKIIALFK